MEPRGSRSIVQVVTRQPRRYWRRRSPQVPRLLHSSYVGDASKRAELNDWLAHEVRPSSEFPQTGPASSPTYPDALRRRASAIRLRHFWPALTISRLRLREKGLVRLQTQSGPPNDDSGVC